MSKRAEAKNRHSRFDEARDLYQRGQYEASLEIYLQLAEEGSTSCQRFVGWMYFTGEGAEQDLGKAMHWLGAAASAGDPEARYGVGRVYAARGDFEDAVTWYEKSARQAFPPAVYRLGLMYERGKGVAVDKDRALSLYTSAAASGHIRSARQESVLLIGGARGIVGRLRGLMLFVRFLGSTIKLAVTDRNSPRLMS